jgi:hypothetical protein
MTHSDFRTNAALRQVLARHFVDLAAVRFGSFRGTVRFNGRLTHVSGRPFVISDRSLLEAVEADVKRIPGVRAVFFDLTNWPKDAGGSDPDDALGRAAKDQSDR